MKSNTIMLIIITLILLAGGYWFFFGNSGNQAPLTVAAPNGSESNAQTQFQVLVSELQPISFDTSIFSNAKFTSLKSLSTAVIPEPSGRKDPFAQVPGITASGG